MLLLVYASLGLFHVKFRREGSKHLLLSWDFSILPLLWWNISLFSFCNWTLRFFAISGMRYFSFRSRFSSIWFKYTQFCIDCNMRLCSSLSIKGVHSQLKGQILRENAKKWVYLTDFYHLTNLITIRNDCWLISSLKLSLVTRHCWRASMPCQNGQGVAL